MMKGLGVFRSLLYNPQVEKTDELYKNVENEEDAFDKHSFPYYFISKWQVFTSFSSSIVSSFLRTQIPQPKPTSLAS